MDPPEYCPKCGRELPGPDAFVCKACGAPVEPARNPAVATPPHFYATAAPLPRMGGTDTARILQAVVVVMIVLAIVGAALALAFSGPGGFTGFRVSAPAAGCWHGTAGDPGSPANVSACGALEVPAVCGGFLSASLVKDDNATWTLSVLLYVNGQVAQEGSTSDPGGAVSVASAC